MIPPADFSGHIPVLLREVLESLQPISGATFVDCTAGRGGHAAAIAKQLAPDGRVVLFDIDRVNLAFSAARVEAESGITPIAVHGSFSAVGRELDARGLRADMILADLGFASNQMDDPERGMSFTHDAPLDMRLDRSVGQTAAQFLERLSERELADIIFQFGEEPYSRRIASKIVEIRAQTPIKSTSQLADLVREAYGSRARTSRMHPATRTFMALRIAVNDELGALRAFLEQLAFAAIRAHESSPTWMNLGARVAVIGFHSLEDRMVKRLFVELSQRSILRVGRKQPMVASEAELAENPRARSAKLRTATVGRPE